MTFNYNPGKMFQYNVQTTVLSRLCLGVRVGIPVRLSFSVVPPSPQNSSGLVYPFPKDFQEAEDDSPIVEDRFSLRRVFERRGQPECFRSLENEFFPTLSYSDFFNLDRGRKLKWEIILMCVKTKYERRASTDPSDQVAADFCKLLSRRFYVTCSKSRIKNCIDQSNCTSP